MAISNLVLTRQIYSKETNGAHAHNRDRVPLTSVLTYTSLSPLQRPLCVVESLGRGKNESERMVPRACFLVFWLLPFLKGLSNRSLCGNAARYVAANCGGHNLNSFEVIHFSSPGRLQKPPPPPGIGLTNFDDVICFDIIICYFASNKFFKLFG